MHSLSRPSRHAAQWPQRRPGCSITRAPACSPLVDGSTRSPAMSLPEMWGGGAGDLIRGLEVPRISARERRPSKLQLLARDRPLSANCGDLAERFVDGFGCCIGLHAGVQNERTRGTAEFERRARAVRVALVL